MTMGEKVLIMLDKYSNESSRPDECFEIYNLLRNVDGAATLFSFIGYLYLNMPEFREQFNHTLICEECRKIY